MSQHETNRAARRRELMLSTIPENGASVAQVAAALGILVISAEQRLRIYAKAGHLFSARVAREPGKKAEAWYFRSRAKRDEVQAACTKKKLKAPAGIPKWDRQRQSAPAPKAEPTNPNNVQAVELPCNLRSRFEPSEASRSINSSECRPWAMAYTSRACRA